MLQDQFFMSSLLLYFLYRNCPPTHCNCYERSRAMSSSPITHRNYQQERKTTPTTKQPQISRHHRSGTNRGQQRSTPYITPSGEVNIVLLQFFSHFVNETHQPLLPSEAVKSLAPKRKDNTIQAIQLGSFICVPQSFCFGVEVR